MVQKIERLNQRVERVEEDVRELRTGFSRQRRAVGTALPENRASSAAKWVDHGRSWAGDAARLVGGGLAATAVAAGGLGILTPLAYSLGNTIGFGGALASATALGSLGAGFIAGGRVAFGGRKEAREPQEEEE